MKRALTILLPVRNVESTLADMILQVLEMAADVSERFEVVIVDDASCDATSEVAHDLSTVYPQVRVLRLKKPLGEEAALRLAAVQERGEVVWVRDGRRPIFEAISGKIRPARPNYLERTSGIRTRAAAKKVLF